MKGWGLEAGVGGADCLTDTGKVVLIDKKLQPKGVGWGVSNEIPVRKNC